MELFLFWIAGNKGVDADIFILEEAARIPRDILEEVIAPMLKMKNSVFIGLSTNMGRDNYFSQLFNKKGSEFDDLFLKVEVNLLCEDCRRNKRKPSECDHNDHRHPHWNIASNKKRAKIFMSSESMYTREVLGAIMSDRECMLDDEWLSRLRQKARVKLPEEELDSLVIYTFVDPTGGSETGSSECGIVSIVRTLSGEVILIGATSVNTQTEPELNDLFQAYFTSFAVHEVLKDLPHFLFIEKNQGGAFIADLMVRRAKWSLPTIQEYRFSKKTSGLSTNRHNKLSGAYSLVWDLYSDRISIADDGVFRSCNPSENKTVINKFLDQLSQLRKEFTARGFEITAKRGGQPDDLCISFLLALYWSYYLGVQQAIEQAEREEQREYDRMESYARHQQQQQTVVATVRRGGERAAFSWENRY